MKNHPRSGLETVLSSYHHEAKEPDKPVITPETEHDYIKYKNRVFRVPVPMIGYLADQPEHQVRIVERTLENGVNHMYEDRVSGCMYCGHYSFDTLGTVMAGNAIFHQVTGTPGMAVNACLYRRVEDVLWATTFTNNTTGEKVMAVKTPCVMDDTLIAYLAETGLLNQYETQEPFKFPRFIDIAGIPEQAARFELYDHAEVLVESVDTQVPGETLIMRAEPGEGTMSILTRLLHEVRRYFGRRQ